MRSFLSGRHHRLNRIAKISGSGVTRHLTWRGLHKTDHPATNSSRLWPRLPPGDFEGAESALRIGRFSGWNCSGWKEYDKQLE